MNVLSVREYPEFKDRAIAYFQKRWGNENRNPVYEDCITHSLTTQNPLPQWYLLMDSDTIAGCAGLITNDFISRMDLYPWVCALYVEESHRGNNYGAQLLGAAEVDTRKIGYREVNLCTDITGYYEKFGYYYIGTGYHPWGESSRIYQKVLI